MTASEGLRVAMKVAVSNVADTKSPGIQGKPGTGTRSGPSRRRSAIKPPTVAAADIPSVKPI